MRTIQSIAAFVVLVSGRPTRLVWATFGESDIVCFFRPYEAQQGVVIFFLLSIFIRLVLTYLVLPSLRSGAALRFPRLLACLLEV